MTQPDHSHPRPAHHRATAAGVLAPESIDVGRRLRALREARSHSIRTLAEASGLASNTLSLIEHGKTSPSVSTLQLLAQTLQVPITAFFAAEVPSLPVVFSKAGQQPVTPLPHGLLANLGTGMARRILEPLLLTLDPEVGSGPQAIAHIGQEFIYCLEGQLTYTVAEEVYLLDPGDSLLFEATLPHRWQNVTATPVRALLVLYPYELPGSAATCHGWSPLFNVFGAQLLVDRADAGGAAVDLLDLAQRQRVARDTLVEVDEAGLDHRELGDHAGDRLPPVGILEAQV